MKKNVIIMSIIILVLLAFLFGLNYITKDGESILPNEANERIKNTIVMPEEIPRDFKIKFMFGILQKNRMSGIDTKEEIIQKDLIKDGTASSEFIIDKELLKEIYNELYSINVTSYQSIYEPYSNAEVTPSLVYTLWISYGDIEYSLYWNDWNMSDEKDAELLRKSFINIMRLIEKLKEFKNLGEPNGQYA